MVSSLRSSDDTSESVMYTLKSVEISTGHARQHGVAIVKSRAHNRARNLVGGLSRHSRPHMTKCSDMEIAALAHVIDMFIKEEFPAERHSQTMFRDGDMCPRDSRSEEILKAIVCQYKYLV